MKKIVSGKILQDKMREAINSLCDTVKGTLGPKGCNVILSHSNFSPFITNDGVTIAESIQSDDEVINVILEISKEASIKTNNTVGDGTTTTLVILQSLINMSLDLINNGVNPMVLKRELSEYLEKILSLLEKEKLEFNDKVIYNIAKVSSGDDDIAKALGEILVNIPYKEAVSIREVETPCLNVKYYSGYKFQSILPSLLLLKDEMSLSYEKALVLIIDDTLSDLENISDVLNEAFNSNKSLVIIAKDFSDYVVNNIVSYVLSGELKCMLLKIDDYGIRERNIQKDLEIISGAKIVNNEKDVSVHSLGVLKHIFVTKDEVRIDFNLNDSKIEYILNVKEELKELDDEYLKEFYLRRLAMFEKGTAQIEIGAFTKTELREKRMRLDDALCAVYSSSDGVVLGGGVTFLKISSMLEEDSNVAKIWKESLEMPFKQLMWNSGIDEEVIKSELEEKEFSAVYNIFNESFEDKKNTYIVDPYSIAVNTLVNACSIAGMLITTYSLVINEQVNNLNKVNDYGDI